MALVVRFLLSVVAVLLFAPTAATAHSTSVDTNPEHGARLKNAPAEVTITLDEKPKQVDAVLTTPDGKVQVMKTRIDGSTVVALMPAADLRGAYGVSYRVVSADGHPVSGSTTFVVTSGLTAVPSVTKAPSEPEEPLTDDRHGFPMIAIAAVAVVGLVALALVAARVTRR